MKIRTTASLVAFASIILALRAAPISADVAFGVSARQAPDNTTIYASDHDSWGAVGSPLSVSATAVSGGVTAFGRETATWAPDGNSGTIVADYGWSFRAPPGASDGVGTGEVGPNWEYRFTADATGFFVMNYVVSGIGDTLFGLQGFRIGEHGYFDLLYAEVDNDSPSVSGQYTRAVTAGSTYDFQIVNLGNINGIIQNLDASLHGEFSWTLPGGAAAGVPETSSTVALLALGLGALGFVAGGRRRFERA